VVIDRICRDPYIATDAGVMVAGWRRNLDSLGRVAEVVVSLLVLPPAEYFAPPHGRVGLWSRWAAVRYNPDQFRCAGFDEVGRRRIHALRHGL
jgi:hypothetical protein